jgi:hypothetical protein
MTSPTATMAMVAQSSRFPRKSKPSLKLQALTAFNAETQPVRSVAIRRSAVDFRRCNQDPRPHRSRSAFSLSHLRGKRQNLANERAHRDVLRSASSIQHPASNIQRLAFVPLSVLMYTTEMSDRCVGCGRRRARHRVRPVAHGHQHGLRRP